LRVIYIAGHYLGDKTEWGIKQNIEYAEKVARRLWDKGWAVICPHKNSAFMGGIRSDPDEDRRVWLDGDLEMVSRCDAILMLNGFETSRGANEELKKARDFGLTIYYEDDMDSNL